MTATTQTPAPVNPATHEHTTRVRQGGRTVTIWSTRDECTVCGCGHPL